MIHIDLKPRRGRDGVLRVGLSLFSATDARFSSAHFLLKWSNDTIKLSPHVKVNQDLPLSSLGFQADPWNINERPKRKEHGQWGPVKPSDGDALLVLWGMPGETAKFEAGVPLWICTFKFKVKRSGTARIEIPSAMPTKNPETLKSPVPSSRNPETRVYKAYPPNARFIAVVPAPLELDVL